MVGWFFFAFILLKLLRKPVRFQFCSFVLFHSLVRDGKEEENVIIQ